MSDEFIIFFPQKSIDLKTILHVMSRVSLAFLARNHILVHQHFNCLFKNSILGLNLTYTFEIETYNLVSVSMPA